MTDPTLARVRDNAPTSWALIAHTLRGDYEHALAVADGDPLPLGVALSMLALMLPGLENESGEQLHPAQLHSFLAAMADKAAATSVHSLTANQGSSE